MKKWIIIMNVLALSILGFFLFSGNNFTGYVVLRDGLDSVIVGSSLYYKVTDVKTGELITNDYITGQEVYFVREGDEIADFSRLMTVKAWQLKADADGSEDYCDNRDYGNRKLYYDGNGNGMRDDGEFYLYSVVVDEKGCFNVRLPDEKFIVVLSGE
ncbi:MAG: hypothetical protein AABY09_03970 [Nanoarchaeota archaeon]